MNPVRIVYRAFDTIEVPLAVTLLVGGLVMVALVGVGVLPPFGGDAWGVRVANMVGWLLVAKEGKNDLKDWADDEIEPIDQDDARR